MRRSHAESHDQLLRELNEERFAALTRISRRLESLIEQLQLAAARIPHLSPTERTRALAAYAELRAEAKQYRWYLEVQREALGLRHHHVLDQFYVIPGPLEG